MPDQDNDGDARGGQNVAGIHDRLRRDILRGKIPPGVTSQAALARNLDVGRTPMREAIRLLQREGLVISEPNRRLRIAELSAADAEELYLMRITLEAIAARITVPELGSDGVAELEGLMAQMDHYMRSEDIAGFRAPHDAFHARLVASAGERVTQLIAQLSDHAERYRNNFGAAGTKIWHQRRVEHRAILDACAEGETQLVVQLLIEHYGRTVAIVLEGIDPSYDAVHLRVACTALARGSELTLDGAGSGSS